MGTDKPLIPQNNLTFFKIVKNDGKFSIDIIIRHKEDIFLDNLFLILKSYLNSNLLFTILIFSVSQEEIKEKSLNLKILNNIRIKKISSLNFVDFFFGYTENYLVIEQYIAENETYALRLVFAEESPAGNKNMIYPIYPGENSLKNLYISEEHQVKVTNLTLQDKIIKLKKKNKELEEELNILKNTSNRNGRI